MIGDGLDLAQTLSISKTGIVTTGYDQDAVVKGQAFQVQRRYTIPAGVGQIVYFVLDTTLAVNKAIFTMPLAVRSAGGLVLMDTYKITSYSGGSEVIPSKINAASSITALSKFFTGVNPVGIPGSDLREYAIGTKSTNQNAGGGQAPSDIFKIFPAGSIVTAKFTNQESDAVIIEFGLIIFEA